MDTEEAYLVNIDGITQAPSTYTITLASSDPDGHDHIIFSTAPPNGSAITVVTLAGAATINFPATHNTSNNDVTFNEKESYS